jgi:hypothetical protein
MTEAAVEVGLGAGPGTPVFPLAKADKGGSGDDEDEHQGAGGDTDDGGRGQSRFGTAVLFGRCRVYNANLVGREDGIAQTEEHAGQGLLLAAGFQSYKIYGLD